MRGRKPTPGPLKLVRGNPGKRPVKDGPKPRPVRPTQPTWLRPEAKCEWSRLAPELERLELLTIVDRAALAAYCTAWGHLVEAEKKMTKGKTLSPWWTVWKQAMQQVRAFATEFGLTPSSRGRIALPQAGTEDELEDFLNEGKG